MDTDNVRSWQGHKWGHLMTEGGNWSSKRPGAPNGNIGFMGQQPSALHMGTAPLLGT